MVTESTKEHGPSNFRCNITCAVVHLTWALSTQRIPLERGRDIAFQYGVANLLSPLFDFIPNSNSLGALPSAIQAGSGKFSLRITRGLHLIYCRCNGELLAIFSSLCTNYARICASPLESRAGARLIYSLDIAAPGTCLSPSTGSRLPRLSGPRRFRRVPYTSPITAAQTDEIRDGSWFYRDS